MNIEGNNIESLDDILDKSLHGGQSENKISDKLDLLGQLVQKYYGLKNENAYIKQTASVPDRNIEFVVPYINGSICTINNHIGLSTLDFKIDNFKRDFNELKTFFYDLKNKQGVLIDTSNDKEYVNPKLMFRDILTEFMVNDVTGNKTEIVLIHIINKVMKALLSEYKTLNGINVMLVYRGGNILKLYKENFDDILPGVARKIMKTEFKKFFKSSDLDYYYVIENVKSMSEEQVDAINDDIQVLSYFGLNIARSLILSNKHIYRMCTYNVQHINSMFDELLTKMNSEKINSPIDYVRDVEYVGLGFNKHIYVKPSENIDIFTLPKEKLEFVFDDQGENAYDSLLKYKKAGRKDIIIKTDSMRKNVDIRMLDYLINRNYFFSDSKIRRLTKSVLSDYNGIFDLYISNNFKIENNILKISFRLSRVMTNFCLIYKTKHNKYGVTNVPAELYDLAIGNKKDRAFPLYTENTIKEYQYTYDIGGDKVDDKIYIPKISTLIKDLDAILFGVEFPWQDEKYEKRIYRLLILIFISELMVKNIDDVDNDLDKINNDLVEISSEEPKSINFDYIRFKMNKANNDIKVFSDKINKYKEPLDNQQAKDIMQNKINIDPNDGYAKYIKTIVECKEKLKNVIRQINLYNLSKGKISDGSQLIEFRP